MEPLLTSAGSSLRERIRLLLSLASWYYALVKVKVIVAGGNGKDELVGAGYHACLAAVHNRASTPLPPSSARDSLLPTREDGLDML